MFKLSGKSVDQISHSALQAQADSEFSAAGQGNTCLLHEYPAEFIQQKHTCSAKARLQKGRYCQASDIEDDGCICSDGGSAFKTKLCSSVVI